MSIAMGGEQKELVAAVRGLLDAQAPPDRILEVMESPDGIDHELYRKMCAELGVAGALVPEEYGGAGLGWPDVALIVAETGRRPIGVPLLSGAVLAVACLTGATTERRARDAYLPPIAAGELTVTVALDASGAAAEVAAAPTGDGWSLTGEVGFVLDGHVAGLLLVPATGDDGIAWYAVDGDAPGLHRRRRDMVDLTRPLARLRLDGAPARRLSAPGIGADVARLRDLAAVMIAAEQTGGAARCLELSVAHATTRTQFGRPIGTFQAVKHACADMLRTIEPVRSAVAFAADAAQAGSAELPMLASVVKAHADEAYFDAACATLQIHGGLGYSWEHEAHLHYKRAATNRSLFGSTAEHRARLADLAGL